MFYRKLGKTDLEVSNLGFGCMRLPHKEHFYEIDEVEAAKMFDYAIEHGVNYFDTAYSFHSKNRNLGGNAEPFLGKYLADRGIRDDVIIQTKLPGWLVNKREDMDKFLDLQLERLQTDYIDIYMLHSLKIDFWNKLYGMDVLEFLDSILEDGRAKYVGFSFHDDLDVFFSIMDSFDKWDVILTQVNYLDEDYKSGLGGWEFVGMAGLGNVIMEPLRGGSLINNIPDEVQALWDKADKKRTPVEWAFEYLCDKPLVTSVFSGMSNMDQVKQNIAIAESCDVNSMSEHDRQILKDVTQVYKSREEIPCTGCRYCMPCHNRVDIPHCFKQYNIAKSLDYIDKTAAPYFWLVNKDERADSCTFCGECNIQCPQGIDIPAEMEKVFDFFHDEEYI